MMKCGSVRRFRNFFLDLYKKVSHTPAAVKLFQRFFAWITGTNQTNLILMKLAEIKAAVKEAAKDNAEAFSEIGTQIGALQKQIDDLIAGNSDPDVTDEDFLTDLESLKTSAQNLADIVPAPAEPPADPAAVAGSDTVRRTN